MSAETGEMQRISVEDYQLLPFLRLMQSLGVTIETDEDATETLHFPDGFSMLTVVYTLRFLVPPESKTPVATMYSHTTEREVPSVKLIPGTSDKLLGNTPITQPDQGVESHTTKVQATGILVGHFNIGLIREGYTVAMPNDSERENLKSN